MFKNQRGAAAVEFAIVVPLLALILFGTIDFALLFYNKQVLTNASREGARSAIVASNWNDPDGDGIPNTLKTRPIDIIEAYCLDRLINLGGDDNNLKIDPTIVDSGIFITATVIYEYEHLFSSITGASETTITGKTVMRQEWDEPSP